MLLCKNLIVVLVFGILFLRNGDAFKDKVNPLNFTRTEMDTTALVTLFVATLFATLLYYLLSLMRIPVILNGVLILWGCCCGSLAFVDELKEYANFVNIRAGIMHQLYMPFMVFSLSFNLDYHLLYKTLSQVLVMSVLIYTINVIASGFLISLMIDTSWPWPICIIFGNMCFATYPILLVNVLNSIGSQTKSTSCLLEGEAMLTLCFHEMIFKIVALSPSAVKSDMQTVYPTGIIKGLIYSFILKVIVGFFSGCFGSILIRICSSDKVSVMLIVIVTPTLANFASDIVSVYGSSAFGVFVVGFMLSLQKKSLPFKLSNTLDKMNEIIIQVMNNYIFFEAGASFTIYIIKNMEGMDYLWVCITYILTNIIRFLTYCIFYPVLAKFGYGIKFQHMIVIFWSCLKNPMLLSSLMTLKDSYEDSDRTIRLIMMHIIPLFLLHWIINTITTPFLVKILGINQVSATRQINMNTCMKIILERKQRTLNVLKMDRLLSDANWLVVNNSTEIRHPYAIEFTNEEENEITLENKFTTCPVCRIDIPNEPTPRELREMMKEARLRILKSKKIEYTKQYENDMLSKEGLQALTQILELAMDVKDATMDLEIFEETFNKFNLTTVYAPGKYRTNINTEYQTVRPPIKQYRRFCYKLMFDMRFIAFMYVVVILNLLVVIVETFLMQADATTEKGHLIVTIINTVFLLIYVAEFVIKVLGYSRVSIIMDGLVTYFKSGWNILDLIVLLVFLLEIILDYMTIFSHSTNQSGQYFFFLGFAKLLRTIKLLQLLRSCRVCYPKLVRLFNRRQDSKLAFAFEIGLCYTKVTNVVLAMLPYMIDNMKVREEMKQRLQNDRLVVMRLLISTVKKRPWIGVTVKTKEGVMTVLNGMKEDVNQLKLSGWIDEVENKKITDSLDECYKFISAINYIPPLNPKSIFMEIVWLGREEEISEYLYANMKTRNLEPGDVVCNEGDVLDGVYILMTGFLLQSYEPQEETLKELEEYGVLPVVDYPAFAHYNEPFSDFMVKGNTVGEHSLLTERPFSAKIISDTHSHVYIMPKECILQAMQRSPDPIFGLECRMWKAFAVKVAVPLMINLPNYQASSTTCIKTALERSFIPDLSNFKIFMTNSKIEDILLIEGMAVDYITRHIYTAPCHIPRNVNKIMMPFFKRNTSKSITTKLLIIPVEHADEYEIMIDVENICELVDNSSSKCIRFRSQESKSNVRQRRKRHLTAFGQATTKNKKQPVMEPIPPKFTSFQVGDGIKRRESFASLTMSHSKRNS